VDVLTVLPMSVKSSMNSGRYLGTVSAGAHAKAVINQLGYDKETFGHWYHGAQRIFLRFPLVSYFWKRENARRNAQWRAEQAAKTSA